jgi:hypothetical protein
MRKLVIAALASVCTGTICGDDLAWSQQPATNDETTTTLSPAEKLTRKEFPCVKRASASVHEGERRANLFAWASVVKNKEVISAKIDEARGFIQLVSQIHLQFDRIDGQRFKIVYKGNDVILGIAETGNEPSLTSVVVIDKATSRLIEMSGGMIPDGLAANSAFYECRDGVTSAP